MIAVNGVSYPMEVKDRASFDAWLCSIDREVETRLGSLSGVNRFSEVMRVSPLKAEDAASRAFAESFVCQAMALHLFTHLVHAPKAKLVWRIRPEFEIYQDTIPSDLSQFMNREKIDEEIGKKTSPVSLMEIKKVLGKEDWATDFVTDAIFPVSAAKGEWCYFKSYMRYAVVLDGEVIPHPHVWGTS